jgi:hypothetical protein
MGQVGWRWHYYWYSLSYVAHTRPVLLAYEASCHINVIGRAIYAIAIAAQVTGQGSATGKGSPVPRVHRPKPQKSVQLFLLLTQIGFMCTVLVILNRGEATGGSGGIEAPEHDSAHCTFGARPATREELLSASA